MGMTLCDKAYSNPTHLPKMTISIHPNPTLLEKLQCYLLLLMGKIIKNNNTLTQRYILKNRATQH
jgi:hypothetical protein